jgi:hypothetical protein
MPEKHQCRRNINAGEGSARGRAVLPLPNMTRGSLGDALELLLLLLLLLQTSKAAAAKSRRVKRCGGENTGDCMRM